MTAWGRLLEAELAVRADDKTRLGAERYFKNAVRFLGVKRAGVNAVIKSQLPAIKTMDGAMATREALALLGSPYMEMRQIGIELLFRKRAQLSDDLLDALEAVFDAHVRDWATCDVLAGRVLPVFLGRAASRRRLLSWSRATNPWRQRAVAVALMRNARRGEFADELIAVCGRIVKNPDRFVQLGAGWALRELSLADRARVIAFLENNARHISREGLRYATEKMPAAVRTRVHDAHARATGRGRPSRKV